MNVQTRAHVIDTQQVSSSFWLIQVCRPVCFDNSPMTLRHVCFLWTTCIHCSYTWTATASCVLVRIASSCLSPITPDHEAPPSPITPDSGGEMPLMSSITPTGDEMWCCMFPITPDDVLIVAWLLSPHVVWKSLMHRMLELGHHASDRQCV